MDDSNLAEALKALAEIGEDLRGRVEMLTSALEGLTNLYEGLERRVSALEETS